MFTTFTTLFENYISEDLEILLLHLTRSPFRRRGTPTNRTVFTTFSALFEKYFSEDFGILVIRFYAHCSKEGGPPPNVGFLRLLRLYLKSIFLRTWKFNSLVFKLAVTIFTNFMNLFGKFFFCNIDI